MDIGLMGFTWLIDSPEPENSSFCLLKKEKKICLKLIYRLHRISRFNSYRNDVICLVFRQFTSRSVSLGPWFDLQNSGLGFGPIGQRAFSKALSGCRTRAQVMFLVYILKPDLSLSLQCKRYKSLKSDLATFRLSFESGDLQWHPVKLLCRSQWVLATTLESQTKANQQYWNTWCDQICGLLGDDLRKAKFTLCVLPL